MSKSSWLRVSDCQLLQADSSAVDVESLRQLQRFLDLIVVTGLTSQLIDDLLGEMIQHLNADSVEIFEPSPQWPIRHQKFRRGGRGKTQAIPRGFLGEILDRNAAGTARAPDNTTALIAVPLEYQQNEQLLLLIRRPERDFSEAELEYATAVGFYLAKTMAQMTSWQIQNDKFQRLTALVDIAGQLTEERETASLLEHIADQATKLLRCERASIFLWDQDRKELVGRPALGLPNNELRIPETTGVVGKVVQSGEILQVNDVHDESSWNAKIDKSTGFQTRNLLCIPLSDGDGKRVGAFEVMNKNSGRFQPHDIETLLALGRQTVAALANVKERQALLRSNAEFEGQARLECQIIGDCSAISAIRAQLERIARTDLPVLVLGESGTGKDVIAKAVHFSSSRHGQPYIPVNCAAIAESLLESELFGHEKGSFTDAHATRPGKFEAASGGTLFLDEVGDLSPGGQAKLLRVLEEKIVYRVGGTQPIPVDTRIVAATNKDLADAVRKNKFREDLFYRLSVVTIDLPPLRDRQEDVLILADHFLSEFCRNAGRKRLRFSAEAKKRLQAHEWPGNVRELRNLLERVAYLCPNETITPADLPFIARPTAEDDGVEVDQLAEATKLFQIRHIQRAIKRTNGNMSDAAELLGLHRPNLYRKMRLLDMEIKE